MDLGFQLLKTPKAEVRKFRKYYYIFTFIISGISYNVKTD